MIDKLVVRTLLRRIEMVLNDFASVKTPGRHISTKTFSDYDYEEAVKTLNSLQTNASVLQEMKKRNQTHPSQVRNIVETIKYLERSGVNLEKLDELSVIHVSGTKGKGSTCAFCESILRHHGYKTGFYSSPHLVAVRERIRINGQPLNQHDFTRHFWKLYNKLNTFKENENDMPPYFKFLTVMAFNVFLAEKVDVAIVEVGIGGEYDCTNVFRKVSTVGITSLGLDHTSLLGNTIEEIAWQKAGIMKPGSVAITVEQPPQALQVLCQRAAERKSTLLMAPALDSYEWDCFILRLHALADVQLLNASLALQLAHTWMHSNRNGSSKRAKFEEMVIERRNDFLKESHIPIAPSFALSYNMASGLKNCIWPGRNQIISEDKIHYFLDGAHTRESLELCAQWFLQKSEEIASKNVPVRVLVFNCTGNRDSKTLLLPLMECNFNLVIFCTNNITITTDSTSDQANFTITTTQQLERCKKNQEAWSEIQKENSLKSEAEIKFFPCVSDTLSYIQRKCMDEALDYHVFVTGSLHLVGSVMSILDPDLKLAKSQMTGVADHKQIIQTHSS